MKYSLYYLFLSMLILSSIGGCLPEESEEETITRTGLRPIYLEGDYRSLSTSAPLPIESLGKIYYKSPNIYVIEKGRGIHVFDNTDPSNPTAILFIHLPLCSDVAIKGNMMYASNYTDLVTIDISNFEDMKILNRIENVYPTGLNYPENHNGYFECVDTSRGPVLGWETAELINPACQR